MLLKKLLIASIAASLAAPTYAGTILGVGSAGSNDMIGLGAYYLPDALPLGIGLTIDNALEEDGAYHDNQPAAPLEQWSYSAEVLRLGIAIPWKIAPNLVIAPNIGVSYLDVEDTATTELNGKVLESRDDSYSKTSISPGIDVMYFVENVVVGVRGTQVTFDSGKEFIVQGSIGLKF